ncbi:MAG TPA: hypothetical protein VK582_11160 [Pyrinomonadaceae bacterium]|nr:hypothetical protein [Pyrinomonadaceae bacterium]
MPRQIHFISTALVSIVLAFAGVFQPPASSSQQSPQTTTAAARNAALIAATADVLKETSEIRQLAILRPVQSSTQSRPEIERMIVKNLDEETTPAQIHAAEITLKKLGLAPPDFQYRALMLRVLTEQVAGYYDPKTGEFHLADWIDLDGQRPIMAHELTHALQDQHFKLRRFEHWPKGDSDAELAVHALIEGDATLAMALYVANNPLRVLLFLKSLGASGMASQELDKAPQALRETLLFPYQQGTDWTRSLYKQAGWDRVSKAFTELPQSTEQILHPEKYFAHEAAVKVTLPDITSLLNAGAPSANSGRWAVRSGQQASSVGRLSDEIIQPIAGSAGDSPALSAQREQFVNAGRSTGLGRANMKSLSPALAGGSSNQAGWKRLDYDVEGEWGFYLILDEFLKSPVESRRAAAGWGGDRFAVYEGPKGEVLFVSLSTWDRENDAREFFDAYAKRTELRYPGTAKSSNTASSNAGAADNQQSPSERRSFRTAEGTVAIELRGSRVLILEGLPEQTTPQPLSRLIWQ